MKKPIQFIGALAVLFLLLVTPLSTASAADRDAERSSALDARLKGEKIVLSDGAGAGRAEHSTGDPDDMGGGDQLDDEGSLPPIKDDGKGTPQGRLQSWWDALIGSLLGLTVFR